MNTPLAVSTAVFSKHGSGLVALTFNDGSTYSIYLNDGSPRSYAHDLLDAWLLDGNEIAEP